MLNTEILILSLVLLICFIENNGMLFTKTSSLTTLLHPNTKL